MNSSGVLATDWRIFHFIDATPEWCPRNPFPKARWSAPQAIYLGSRRFIHSSTIVSCHRGARVPFTSFPSPASSVALAAPYTPLSLIHRRANLAVHSWANDPTISFHQTCCSVLSCTITTLLPGMKSKIAVGNPRNKSTGTDKSSSRQLE